MSRRPVRQAGPVCGRHRRPYELAGGRAVCRSCDTEASEAARLAQPSLCAPSATTT